MPIGNFHPDEFAKSMAQQAMQVIPHDLSQADGEYIINKVYQFAMLAGDALNQDPNLSLSLDKAQLITQFIAEWTYHKAIDVIRSNIPQDQWDQILQQIAFAIFQKTKELHAAGADLAKSVKAIETVVSHSYEFAVKELANTGVVKEEDLTEILSHSNLEEMAKNTYTPDETVTEEQRATNLKYASVAILLKSMSPKHRDKILSNLEEKNEIVSYMEDQNLSDKVNHGQVKDCLDKIKDVIVAKRKEDPPINYVGLIKELKDQFSEKEIYNLIKFERKKINNFVAFALEEEPSRDMMVKFSPHLARAICGYLKTKLNSK